jgi:hypothetical protein
MNNDNKKQKTEDRRQKTEDRRQKTEDRRQKTEILQLFHFQPVKQQVVTAVPMLNLSKAIQGLIKKQDKFFLKA